MRQSVDLQEMRGDLLEGAICQDEGVRLGSKPLEIEILKDHLDSLPSNLPSDKKSVNRLFSCPRKHVPDDR